MKLIILIIFLSCNSTTGRFSNLGNSGLTQTDTLPELTFEQHDTFFSSASTLVPIGDTMVSFWVNDSISYEIPLDVLLFYKKEIIKILERE